MSNIEPFHGEDLAKLREFLDKHNPGHDEIQMKYFIVGSGITDYGKYKQALAEITTHYTALKMHHIDRKKTLAKMDMFKARLACITGDTALDLAKRNLLEVEIESLEMRLEEIEKQARRNLNELNMMFALAKEYEKKIEGQNIDALSIEYHVKRLERLVEVNTVFNGNNLGGVMETILNLPDEHRNYLLSACHVGRMTVLENNMRYQAELMPTQENGDGVKTS